MADDASNNAKNHNETDNKERRMMSVSLLFCSGPVAGQQRAKNGTDQNWTTDLSHQYKRTKAAIDQVCFPSCATATVLAADN